MDSQERRHCGLGAGRRESAESVGEGETAARDALPEEKRKEREQRERGIHTQVESSVPCYLILERKTRRRRTR